jgi:hypothetical protein
MVEKVLPWLFWRCKCPTFQKQFVNSMWLYEFGHIVYTLCSKVQCRHTNYVNIWQYTYKSGPTEGDQQKWFHAEE